MIAVESGLTTRQDRQFRDDQPPDHHERRGGAECCAARISVAAVVREWHPRVMLAEIAAR